MTAKITVPETVLNGSFEDKRDYFYEKTLKHPKQVECFEQAQRAIANPHGNRVVMIVGPTGAGKSKLVSRLEQFLLDEFNLSRHGPAALPYLSIEAMSVVRDNFDWSIYFSQLLHDANELLIDQKKLSPAGSHEVDLPESIKRLPKTASSLCMAFINCVRARQPAVVITDEAQGIAKVTNSRRMLDQIDLVKSVANLTQVLQILVGTYDLLALHNLSGQLGRRIKLIHFERYKPDCKQDREVFRSIVYSLQQHLPLPTVPNLSGRLDLMLEGSQGCVGILKEWLLEALQMALYQDAPTLTNAVLEEAAYSGQTLGQIKKEISEGERRLELGVDDIDLSSLFSGKTPKRKTLPDSKERPKRRGSKRPGTRNPVRDKVGVSDDG